MEKFIQHTGILVPIMNDNIDTDQLIPKAYLKRVEKTGFGKYLFDEWRYLPDGSDNPNFPLNDPDYRQATILVAGDNFGSGSSREHAAWALKDYGFRAIIAGSFSDIFFMNATKNGLVPVTLPQAAREQLAKISRMTPVTVDLEQQEVRADEYVYPFAFDATWREKLLNGLDDIAITLADEELIESYEQTIPAYWQKAKQQ
ncbi:3-isopropylmalate dehydratase small subunit [Enterococcus hirae]|nr:3-isopropylmalate dehydratase small subunit [Enterococcus hirae]